MKGSGIQKIIDRIIDGEECESDVGMLFIRLRPYVSKDPILLDMSNFIAHHDGRNQGASYDFVNDFVLSFLSASEKGGTINPKGPVFQSKDVMEKLMNKLSDLGINFEEKALQDKSDFLMEAIKSLITDTKFEFANPRVYKCYVGRHNNTLRLCIQFDLNGPIIKTSPDAVISIDLFD